MARKEVIQIRCSDLEKERWKDIAASQHLELSAWIRLVLTKAASGAPRETGVQQTIETFEA
jgi:antitoxin component of RelBE/YafQ-DinJ toxin-antitoxin module